MSTSWSCPLSICKKDTTNVLFSSSNSQSSTRVFRVWSMFLTKVFHFSVWESLTPVRDVSFISFSSLLLFTALPLFLTLSISSYPQHNSYSSQCGSCWGASSWSGHAIDRTDCHRSTYYWYSTDTCCRLASVSNSSLYHVHNAWLWLYATCWRVLYFVHTCAMLCSYILCTCLCWEVNAVIVLLS